MMKQMIALIGLWLGIDGGLMPFERQVLAVELNIPAKTFHCQSLKSSVAYSVYVPSGSQPVEGWPVVFLLHGAGRNHRTIPDHPVANEMIRQQPFVMVFPDGKAGWYTDSLSAPESRFQSMLKELLDLVRKEFPVSSEPTHTGICGWSMGGFGAVRFAEANPGDVHVVATTMALLDFPNPKLPREKNFRIPRVFGDDPEDWKRYNPMNSIENLRGKELLFVAPRKAFDIQMNRNFHQALEAAEIPHELREVDGAHDFDTVLATLPLLLRFMQESLVPKA